MKNGRSRFSRAPAGGKADAATGGLIPFFHDMDMTWTQGRRLNTLTKNGVTSTYKYNSEGLRTSKKVGSDDQWNYTWEGGNLISQENGTRKIYFFYDANGEIAGIRNYTSEDSAGRYMFYKNVQGDVLGLYNSAGKIVIRYEYDSWGKVISVKDVDGNEITNPNSLGHINPIRYRGYYYDTESGLYYLQSRYYDPENGRFINADTIAGNTGNSTYNLFVYCANNPIMNADPTGRCTNYSVSVEGCACGESKRKNSNSVPTDRGNTSITGNVSDRERQARLAYESESLYIKNAIDKGIPVTFYFSNLTLTKRIEASSSYDFVYTVEVSCINGKWDEITSCSVDVVSKYGMTVYRITDKKIYASFTDPYKSAIVVSGDLRVRGL